MNALKMSRRTNLRTGPRVITKQASTTLGSFKLWTFAIVS